MESLPIINLAPFLNSDPSDSGRIAVAAALHSACVDFGFFYLDISTFVDPSEPEELTRLASQFFALPQEEKDKLSLKNQDYARGMRLLPAHLQNCHVSSGYARLKENVTNGKADNHEGLDLYKPVENPNKLRALWGENQWPAVPGFKEKFEVWIEKMKQLGLIVMEA
jgi:isopenicillin N synthase-like dioxygenase